MSRRQLLKLRLDGRLEPKEIGIIAYASGATRIEAAAAGRRYEVRWGPGDTHKSGVFTIN